MNQVNSAKHILETLFKNTRKLKKEKSFFTEMDVINEKFGIKTVTNSDLLYFIKCMVY